MDPISGFFGPVSIPPEQNSFECIYRSGGWCEIWRGVRDGQWRAYKCLKEPYREQFLYQELLRKEFEICHDLSHPGIRRCYALTELPELGYCIEMEYVEGENLSSLLDRGALSAETARTITQELLEAVEYLHQRQIAHNDLKPSNILITSNGNHVKLIDFGLADTDSWAILKLKGGTPTYAAPELQKQHEGTGGQVSDIYSLGVILGKLGSVPARVVRHCCMANPQARWSSVARIREELDRRRRFPWPLAAAVLLVLVPLLWFHGPVITFVSSLFPVKNAPWTGLCVEAIEDGEVSFHNICAKPIQYSFDARHWATADTLLTLPVKRRDCIYFRGSNSSYTRRKLENSRYSHFHFSAPCYVYGNIMSLIDSTAFESTTTLTRSHNFAKFFEGEQNLRFHPKKKLILPATGLTIGCYRWMFKGCTGITFAPDLPATQLKGYCYQEMFMDCASLRAAPALPASVIPLFACCGMFTGCHALVEPPAMSPEQVDDQGCRSMFQDCRNLVRAPALPATRLGKACYEYMFEACPLLAEAPELPATTLEDKCYSFMFSRTGITKAPALPATVLCERCYAYMFAYCPELSEPPVLHAPTLAPTCYMGMFQYCSKLNRATLLATDISAPDCLTHWLLDVAPDGTLTLAKDSPLTQPGPSGIPKYWQVTRVE